MRIMTKSLVDGWNFYSFVGCEPYESFVEEFKEAFVDVSLMNGNIDILSQEYEEHIKKTFKSGIFEEAKAKNLIFQKDGRVRKLDEETYNGLSKLRKILDSTMKRGFAEIERHAENIRKGDYLPAIKSLAMIGRHDAEIQFLQIKENTVQVQVHPLCRPKEIFEFHLVGNLNFDLQESEENSYMKILYEELFDCGEGDFEYNLLLEIMPKAEQEQEYLTEISFLFSRVDIGVAAR
ncbi:MAG: hypothetical protein FWH04_01160 [Oscillospiraceae bacterium]|nr:hypothetical protein [Oscillospiraceae bacterium]